MSDIVPAVSTPILPLATGQDLKQWRVALGWSQGRLAEFLGVHVRTLARYEKDRALDRLVSLALTHLRDCRGMGGDHA